VYYLAAEGGKLFRVADDLVRPNGVIGTPDGKILYIADHGDSKTYAYQINPDGTLSDKTLFTSHGSDGMTMDNRGNVYLTNQTDSTVDIYNPAGEKINAIQVPERPANVCFGGKDKKTLFITAMTSVYSIPMQVNGL
jgi:gluconolactonase